MPRLKISGSTVRDVPLVERLTVGRVESCDVSLKDDGCSRQHCEFVSEGGSWLLRDLGSSNGTFLNGDRVEQATLNDGDKVRIGSTTLQFLTSVADAQIRFTEGEHAGEALLIAGERTTLGRRKDKNAQAFDDIQVSGVHLEIAREPDGWVLRDLGSTNGTMLDGRKVDEVPLGDGDTVQFGSQVFVFEDLLSGGSKASPGRTSKSKSSGDASSSGGATAHTPPKGGRLGSLLALVAVVLVAASAAWFAFFREGRGGGSTAARLPASAPSGNLLTSDWSFEDVTNNAWDSVGPQSMLTSRSGAHSGARALRGTVESGGWLEAVREPVKVRGGETYTVAGVWSVDEGAHVGLEARFEAPSIDEGRGATLAVPLAQRGPSGGDYEAFEGVVCVPTWASGMAIAFVARGGDDASVRVDDVSLVAGGVLGETPIGALTLIDRGGAAAIRLNDPLVELFHPYGTLQGSEEGTTVRAPVGLFDTTCVVDGDTLVLKRGDRHPTDGFVARLASEFAEAGVYLLTDRGGQRPPSTFDEEGVRAVILGADAERLEWRLSEPCRVIGTRGEDGAELRLLPPGNELRVTVRAEFTDERREASLLLVAADRARGEGHFGEAMSHLRDLRDRLPYDPQLVAQARDEEVEILREIDVRMAEVEALRESAEFLDSLPRYRRVHALADSLMQVVGGTPVAETVRGHLEFLNERITVLSGERHEEEAMRVRNVLRAFESYEEEDRSASAARLREALNTTYGDTAAGGEGA